MKVSELLELLSRMPANAELVATWEGTMQSVEHVYANADGSAVIVDANDMYYDYSHTTELRLADKNYDLEGVKRCTCAACIDKNPGYWE